MPAISTKTKVLLSCLIITAIAVALYIYINQDKLDEWQAEASLPNLCVMADDRLEIRKRQAEFLAKSISSTEEICRGLADGNLFPENDYSAAINRKKDDIATETSAASKHLKKLKREVGKEKAEIKKFLKEECENCEECNY